MEQRDNRVVALEEHHHGFAREYLHDGRGGIVVTDENTAINYLKELGRLAKRIRSDKSEAWRTETRFHRTAHSLTRLGWAVWLSCRTYDSDLLANYANHRFDPHLIVMLRTMRRWANRLIDYEIMGKLSLREEEPRRILSHIVEFTRRVCRSKQFRYVVNNYQRNATENFKSCCRYAASWFGVRARLLVLRVDLYFRPEAKGWGYTEAADRAYDKFLRALSEGRIVPDVIGWIGKRENGFSRGMHYHVLVALDGHKHWQAANLSRQIGEYWEGQCTGPAKLGSYFNCYVRKDYYKFNGLGLVHASDRDKLIGIREALRYITKEDMQLRAGSGRERNLRKGLAAC